MLYDFNEHKHRFAIWTAARAQRAYAKTELIETAISATDLKVFSESAKELSQDEFDVKHQIWCAGRTPGKTWMRRLENGVK